MNKLWLSVQGSRPRGTRFGQQTELLHSRPDALVAGSRLQTLLAPGKMTGRRAAAASLVCKGRACRSCALGHDHSAPPLHYYRRRRQYVSRWGRLCAIKSWFMGTGN